MSTFKDILKEARRLQRERIRKAGKHTCVREHVGTVRRLTGRGGKFLKRPVVTRRFYACKICGKDME